MDDDVQIIDKIEIDYTINEIALSYDDIEP